jgi:hypothetical protein
MSNLGFFLESRNSGGIGSLGAMSREEHFHSPVIDAPLADVQEPRSSPLSAYPEWL